MSPGVWVTRSGHQLSAGQAASWERYFRNGQTDGRGHFDRSPSVVQPAGNTNVRKTPRTHKKEIPLASTSVFKPLSPTQKRQAAKEERDYQRLSTAEKQRRGFGQAAEIGLSRGTLASRKKASEAGIYVPSNAAKFTLDTFSQLGQAGAGIPAAGYYAGEAAVKDTKGVAHGDFSFKHSRTLGKGLAKGLVEPFQHPIRDRGFLALNLLAGAGLAANTAARVGAAGRAASVARAAGRAASEGRYVPSTAPTSAVGQAAKGLARRPVAPQRTLRFGGLEVHPEVSRNMARAYVQHFRDRRLMRKAEAHPEGPAGAKLASKIGKELTTEGRITESALRAPAMELAKRGSKLSNAQETAVRVVAEGQSIDARIADHRLERAATDDNKVKLNLSRKIRLLENARKYVVDGADGRPELNPRFDTQLSLLYRRGAGPEELRAVYEKAAASSTRRTRLGFESGMLDEQAAEARVHAPGRGVAGARWERPTPGKMGRSPALASAIKYRDRLHKAVTRAEERVAKQEFDAQQKKWIAGGKKGPPPKPPGQPVAPPKPPSTPPAAAALPPRTYPGGQIAPGRHEIDLGEGSPPTPPESFKEQGHHQAAAPDELSPEYRAALDASNVATKRFRRVQEEYRARRIDDTKYLAERKRYEEAQAEFDKAFAAEQNRPRVKPSEREQQAIEAQKIADRTGLPIEHVRDMTEDAVAEVAPEVQAWRDTFQQVPEASGQTGLHLGADVLPQEATLADIEAQAQAASGRVEEGRTLGRPVEEPIPGQGELAVPGDNARAEAIMEQADAKAKPARRTAQDNLAAMEDRLAEVEKAAAQEPGATVKRGQLEAEAKDLKKKIGASRSRIRRAEQKAKAERGKHNWLETPADAAARVKDLSIDDVHARFDDVHAAFQELLDAFVERLRGEITPEQADAINARRAEYNKQNAPDSKAHGRKRNVMQKPVTVTEELEARAAEQMHKIAREGGDQKWAVRMRNFLAEHDALSARIREHEDFADLKGATIAKVEAKPVELKPLLPKTEAAPPSKPAAKPPPTKKDPVFVEAEKELLARAERIGAFTVTPDGRLLRPKGSNNLDRLRGALSVLNDRIAQLESARQRRMKPVGLRGAEDWAGGRFRVPYTPTLPARAQMTIRSYRGGEPLPPGSLTNTYTDTLRRTGNFRDRSSRLIAESELEMIRYTGVLRKQKQIRSAAQEAPLRDDWIAVRLDNLAKGALPRVVKEVQDAARALADPLEAGRYTGELEAELNGAIEKLRKAVVLGDRRQFASIMHGDPELAKLYEDGKIGWVPPQLLGEYGQQTFKLQGVIGHRPVAMVDAVNNASRLAILYLKPAYAVPNMLGNLTLNIIQQGYAAPKNLKWAAQVNSRLSPLAVSRLDSIMGEGVVRALAGDTTGVGSHAVQAAASVWSKGVDLPFRRASLLHEIRRTLRENGMKDNWENVERMLTDPSMEGLLIRAAKPGIRNIVDYSNLSPREREVVRRTIFFYPWVKGSTIVTGRIIAEHPVFSAFAANAGEQARRETVRRFGGHGPSYMNVQGAFPIGDKIVNPAAAAIFGSPAQAVEVAKGLVHGDVTQASKAAQFLTPFANLGIAAATHVDPGTGFTYPARFSALDIAKDQLLNPTPQASLVRGIKGQHTSGAIVQPTAGQAIGRFFGGGLVPANYSRENYLAAGRKERRTLMNREERAAESIDFERNIAAGRGRALGLGALPPQVRRSFARLKERDVTMAKATEGKKPGTRDYEVARYKADLDLAGRWGYLDKQTIQQQRTWVAHAPIQDVRRAHRAIQEHQIGAEWSAAQETTKWLEAQDAYTTDLDAAVSQGVVSKENAARARAWARTADRKQIEEARLLLDRELAPA